jgi:hypothetical protein
MTYQAFVVGTHELPYNYEAALDGQAPREPGAVYVFEPAKGRRKPVLVAVYPTELDFLVGFQWV